MYITGASEIVFNKCDKWLVKDSQVMRLTEEDRLRIEDETINDFAEQAYRTICLCYKDFPIDLFEEKKELFEDDIANLEEELEKDMIMIGILGIEDPIRPDVPSAVLKCQDAGITVRMVTGDNINTAKAIALKCGIITKSDMKKNYACMLGQDFRQFVGGLKEEPEDPTDKKNKKMIRKVKYQHKFNILKDELKVLARSSPEDKYILVTGLKAGDVNVIAVTGDGTNDAPALKKADVGFAMGIAGTEVAKEAADIILLDDNFSSIVTAAKWGRNIYNCIRKFLQFQLTVNVVAIFMAFMGGVVLGESPLTAIQLLWVNLIMDTFAALALATEPPSDDLLKGKPYSKTESIITKSMWRNIVCQSLYQIIVLSFMLFLGAPVLPC